MVPEFFGDRSDIESRLRRTLVETFEELKLKLEELVNLAPPLGNIEGLLYLLEIQIGH